MISGKVGGDNLEHVSNRVTCIIITNNKVSSLDLPSDLPPHPVIVGSEVL